VTAAFANSPLGGVVRNACAFLNQQVRRRLEEKAMAAAVTASTTNDELYLSGFTSRMVSARLGNRSPCPAGQAIVSRIGVRALDKRAWWNMRCSACSRARHRFNAVPVAGPQPGKRFWRQRVNKTTLSPNLEVLEQLPEAAFPQAAGDRAWLPIQAGCEPTPRTPLPLEQLYVLACPCVDNVSRAGLQTFLESASSSAGHRVHYEFMAGLPAFISAISDGPQETGRSCGLEQPHLKDVFSRPLPECFRYVNAEPDLVRGVHGCTFGRHGWCYATRSASCC